MQHLPKRAWSVNILVIFFKFYWSVDVINLCIMDCKQVGSFKKKNPCVGVWIEVKSHRICYFKNKGITNLYNYLVVITFTFAIYLKL